MNELPFDRLSQHLIQTPLLSFHPPQAAVLVLISQGSEPFVLYTKRASHLRQHPGEVCFPGGMWEIGDADLFATALREVEEEIALPAAEIKLIGRLPQSKTIAGIPVTPFVASFNSEFSLRAAPDELESIFGVPLKDFRRGIKVRDDRIERQGKAFTVPVYHYHNYEIWGFTATVTAQLLDLIDRLDIPY